MKCKIYFCHTSQKKKKTNKTRRLHYHKRYRFVQRLLNIRTTSVPHSIDTEGDCFDRIPSNEFRNSFARPLIEKEPISPTSQRHRFHVLSFGHKKKLFHPWVVRDMTAF